MSRAPGTLRSISLRTALVCASALALSACGTRSSTTSAPVEGTPSINISVPLSQVACTQSNSCVAVGTSPSGGPSAAGQVRLHDGLWVAVAVPQVATAFVTSASCARSQCLLAGSQPTGDLVWRYDAAHRDVTALAAPPGGTGVDSLSCVDTSFCMLADTTISGPRLFTTPDAGATWTPMTTPTAAAGDRIDHLACTSSSQCLAVTQLAAGGVDISSTTDGGATWSVAAIGAAPSFSSVASLSCAQRQCTMVDVTATGTGVSRGTDFGGRWGDVRAVSSTPSLVACTNAKHCVLTGRAARSTPWIETVVERHVAPVSLKYVPTPLDSLSCGTSVCAAVSATTVVSLRP